MSFAVEAAPAPAPPTSSVEEATHELTAQEVRAALSDLGHNRNGELVYRQCILSFKRLSCLTGLERYSNLQQLVLDNNALTELTAVQHMPQLVYLSARHNKLTCDVFASLTGASGCLERLHLDDNCLTSLNGLEALPFLTDLTCNKNQIESLSARCLSAAQRLMRLRLNHNRISSIDMNAFDAARHLRTLELEHNALNTVDFLHSVSAQVERLVLAANHIKHLDSAVQHLTGLTYLDIRSNELSSLTELQVLRELSALRILSFDGNEGLAHLPHSEAATRTLDLVALPSAVGRTEYHAEVVMSDEENDKGECADLRASGIVSSSCTDERSCTVNPTSTSALHTEGEEDDSGRSRDKDDSPLLAGGKDVGESPSQHRYSMPLPSAAVAAPTTASYVSLAAVETHDFIHTVGTVARDAALCVTVDKAKEIQTLSEEDQVYLWTLSLLPRLLEVNGRPIRSVDVARANLLFPADL